MEENIEFFSGVYEVELTDELIEKLVQEKKWGDPKTLKEFANEGAKRNTKKNSLIIK